MLENSRPFSSFSVNNLEKARAFYQNILGLSVEENAMGVLELRVEGGQPISIYPKDNHIPATFTVLNFPVTDIEDMVECLKSKGVTFEHYDRPQTDAIGICCNESGPSIAWFKDPAGNILSVIEVE
ncbi:VOC family protein [Pareuzebyella sediminis]|uniref:VOC family protein n=1 Tax=Pareuzebyella sediminis TaxID=2607998 RepID=UPI0011EF0057|nr:VOC family protein [Pareuzebyella sediminis]